MDVRHRGRGDIVIGDKQTNINFYQKRWVWLLAAFIIAVGICSYMVYAKQHAHAEALPVVQTEFINNLTLLGVFYQTAWPNYNPAAQYFDEGALGLETSQQKQSRLRSTFMDNLNFLQQTWQITPVDQHVFKANERDLNNNVASYFNKAYEALGEFQYAVNTYIDFSKDKINIAIDANELINELNELFLLKRIEARIAVVNAVLAYGETVQPEDWTLIRSTLRMFSVFLEQEKYPEVRKELIEVQQTLFKEKSAAINGQFDKSEYDNELSTLPRPPQIKTQIDSAITDYSALIAATASPFLSGDTTAAIYYLTKAMPQVEGSKALTAFVSHSIAKLRSPNLYPEGINFLVLETKPASRAAKAGVKIGDILYKINDHVLKETFDVGQILAATSPKNDNLLTLYRDGEILQISIRGNDPLGLTITSLGYFSPDVK